MNSNCDEQELLCKPSIIQEGDVFSYRTYVYAMYYVQYYIISVCAKSLWFVFCGFQVITWCCVIIYASC